jgi:hypothetical protein
MDTKEYLSQYRDAMIKIDKLKKDVEYYNHMSYTLPGMSFDQVRVDGTKKMEAPFTKWIHKVLDCELKIKKLEKQLPTIKDQIISTIEKLEDTELKSVLIFRYIDWLSWSEIAKEMYCSYATARRKHNYAIEEITPYVRMSRGEQG